MYSEQYPKLQQAFPFDNFEVIVEAIEKHFPSLFNLDIIENELKNGQRNGSYIQFFPSLSINYALLSIMTSIRSARSPIRYTQSSTMILR